MAESLFIEPIRRWLSSRSGKNKADPTQSVETLTPEQQFAQLRGLPVEVPEQPVAVTPANGDVSPGLGVPQPPMVAMVENPVICQQCSQMCAQDARFCPNCSIPLNPQPVLPTNTYNSQPSMGQCVQCGQACPEGYELCASCTQSNQPLPEETGAPLIKRVSIGEGNTESSDDSQGSEAVVQMRSLTTETDDTSESTNVTMAESLRNIFSGQTSINPDTVAFLERYGTVGTQELLDELRSLHRILRR